MFTSTGLKKRHYMPFIGLVAFGVLSVAVGVNLSLKDVYSATGSMYLQAPTTAIKKGKATDIAVRINPGGAHVDTVTATIGFDPSKFSYSGINFASSPFTTQLPTKVTDKDVTITSSFLGGSINTDSLVAIISFTPKVFDTKFQADFSLSGNAAVAGTATDPACTSHTFVFTQSSATNIPTNPLQVIFPPDNQSAKAGKTTDDSPLAHLTPADGAAVYNGAQILLKTSDAVAQIRRISPTSLIMIGAGFALMCITLILFARYKKRHAEFVQLQSHMNIVRQPSSL